MAIKKTTASNKKPAASNRKVAKKATTSKKPKKVAAAKKVPKKKPAASATAGKKKGAKKKPAAPAAAAAKKDAFPYTIEIHHGNTDQYAPGSKYTYRTNLSKAQINNAIAAGNKKIGFDFQREACSDYEQRGFKQDHITLMRAAGMFVPEPDDDDNDEEDDGIVKYGYLTPEVYFDLWVGLIKLTEPSFVLKPYMPDAVLHIGGEGCFYGGK